VTTRVMVLEAAGPEAGALVAAAIANGYEVHAVTQPDYFLGYGPDLRSVLAGHLLTDFTRPATALSQIIAYGRQVGAHGALTTNEYLTPLLALACEALGLPGNDPTLAPASRDKAVMHAAFVEHGVATPRTRVVRHQDLRSMVTADEIAFPAVIKPATGAGSAGVTVVHTHDRCMEAWREAQAVTDMYGSRGEPLVLVQDYITGTEYSVESFTQYGTTTHVGVTKKIVTSGSYRVELGHSLPTHLPLAVEQKIHAQTERAITAVGGLFTTQLSIIAQAL